MKILYGTAIFKMTLTLTFDLDLDFFLMCYYFSVRRTHWWSNFSNRSINKDIIGYAAFWPFKVKRFYLGKKWLSFSNSACQGLSVCWFWAKSLLEFEYEYFSFKWPWPWPLTLTLNFFNVLLLLDETNTLVAEFFKLLQKWRFCRVRRFLKWPWPWPMTLTSDFGNVLLLLDDTNTLVVEFFKSVHKQRFYRVRSILTF